MSSAQQQRPASSGKGVAVQGLKLPFVVTFASSYDEGYAPTQLEQQTTSSASSSEQKSSSSSQPQPTPHIKGWQSAKYCPYPQTLVLKFPGYFDLRKIQILSHQAKIANTIELYAGSSPHTTDEDDSSASYTRLGYLSLDCNERSGYKARELKSVYVNARGNFLKLVIKKCYMNTINQYNQVGIIAINVVGTKATSEFSNHAIQEHHHGHQHAHNPSSSSNQTSVVSSLMSQYQCDERTAIKIYDLEKLKSRAIATEDYDEAKKLKYHLDLLKELGGKIARLELEKAAAVEREDYDTAKGIKKEIDALRNGGGGGGSAAAMQRQQRQQPQQQYPSSSQQQSLSRVPSNQKLGRGAAARNSDPYDDQPIHGQPQREPLQQQYVEFDAPLPALAHAQNEHSHHHEPPRDPDYDDHGRGAAPPQQQDEFAMDPEDRPIKPSKSAVQMRMEQEEMAGAGGSGANARQQQQPTSYDISAAFDDANGGDEMGGGGGGTDANGMPTPEPLTAVNRKDAEPLIDVFGDHTILCLYSRHWLLRQQALKDITQSLVDSENGGGGDTPLSTLSSRDIFQLGCRVLKKVIGDKVSQVFLSACQLLSILLRFHAPKLKPEDVKYQLDPIVQIMIDKLSSQNIRERDGALQLLTYLAFDKNVHPSIVPTNLLLPLKKKDRESPLPLKTRAGLLLKCVIFYGLDDSFALSLSSLTKFLLPQLLHRDAGVRDGMCNLVAGMSLIIGPQKLLPYFKDIRPQTLQALQQKLDDVSSGVMVFLKPAQPRLDQQYSSEADTTFTVNGVAGGSASTAAVSMTAASAASPPQPKQARLNANANQQAATAPPAKQKSNNQQQQQKQQQQHQHQHQHQPQHSNNASVNNSIAEEDASAADLQGKCQFCGLEDPSFTEEQLDLHYWADCPLLISCASCEQVIEIPTLNEHRLFECEVAGAYQECQTCHQAIDTAEFAAHQSAGCAPPEDGWVRCALCHEDISLGPPEDGWRHHLLVETCQKNTRPVKNHQHQA